MLSPRDKRIIKFMEDTEVGLTIQQAAMMFFPERFAYDYARLRLNSLYDKGRGVLKRYKYKMTRELIYYLEKKPSYHDNAVMNVYANLVKAGFKITRFEPPEFPWLEGKYKSDAFIIAETKEESRYIIVEVDLTHPTNIEKYEDIYKTEELQREFEVFPMVIVLSDIERNYKSENFTIVNMDISCTGFINKVLI